MTLLETLRALAPVVTPGEWQRCDDDVVSKSDDALIASVYPGGYTRNGLTDRNRMRANATAIITLRNALPELIAALEVVELVRDEDWLAERISDSLDVDWRPIDAARAIIAALPKDEV